MAIQDQGIPTILVIPLISLFMGIILFVALLFRAEELFIFASLTLSLIGTVKLWAKGSSYHLLNYFSLDKRKLFPGEHFVLTLFAENRKILPITLSVTIPFKSLSCPETARQNLTKEGTLLWYQKAEFKWEILAEKRGIYEVGPPRLSSADLFAFFPIKLPFTEVHRVIVYPRLIPIKPFSITKRDFFGIPGVKSPFHDPVYILGTRDYQPSQPSTYIHWKASARSLHLQEKIFEATTQEKVVIIVEVQGFARKQAKEDFEQTLECAASLAYNLDKKGHALGLVTNGLTVMGRRALLPVARNYEQFSSFLEVLAMLIMRPRRPLEDILREEVTLPWGTSAVCFFYQEDPSLTTVWEIFKHAKIPACFFVSHGKTATLSPDTTCPIHSLKSLTLEGGDRR